MTLDAVIREARIREASGNVDIGISGGRITSISNHLPDDATVEINALDNLVLPAFVNAHLHLDKCLIGDSLRSGLQRSLQQLIELTWERKRDYTVEDISSRAGAVLEASIANGTGTVRAFVDVDPIGGLVGIQALLGLRSRYGSELEIQIVAHPQEGIFRASGTERLMEQAMELGADIVGGVPAYELTQTKVHDHVDFCLALAKRYDRDIHMLIDDSDDPAARSLEYLAIRTMEEGYEGRVTAGHCGALAAYDHAHAEHVIDLIRKAEISICSNPHISLVLMGHTDRGVVRRGITRVGELLRAGVNVLAAQDDVNDPFYPFGKPDQLEVASYMAHTAHLVFPRELDTVIDMVTYNAAKAMRLPDYGVKVGARAGLVLLGSRTVAEAIRTSSPARTVFLNGRVAARTTVDVQRYPAGQS